MLKIGVFALLICCADSSLSPDIERVNFWTDFRDATVGAITAPIVVPKQIIQGNNVFDVARGQFAPAGRLLQNTTGTVASAMNTINSIPRDAINNTLGSGWVSAYDTLTATQRVEAEMVFTTGRFLGGCMQGHVCSVQTLVAIPFAAALRDAYKVYSMYAQPLNPLVISALSRVMPLPTLIAARYVVAPPPNFTVPGFILEANDIGGNNQYAVTIGNLMIFSTAPDVTTRSGMEWLLHELHHTEQYESYSSNLMESIDGFAANYMTNSASMEAEARSVAAVRVSQLENQQPVASPNNVSLPQTSVGNVCRTPIGACPLPGTVPVGTGCYCPTPSGPINGGVTIN